MQYRNSMKIVAHTGRFLLLLCCLQLVALSAVQALAEPRQSILAGSWYPADAGELRQSVAAAIAAADVDGLPGTLLGLVAPHAGHVYSGAIAGHAYALLQKDPPDTVVVIAPSHRHPFQGVSVYDAGGYATPLGVMPLDEDVIAELRKQLPSLKHVPQAHSEEHSLEIQIPFLQVAAPQARLVPLVVGQQGMAVVRELAQALAGAVQASKGKRVVLLASSDLSHFHDKETCAQLDGRIHEAVRAMDAWAIAACMADGSCEACGAGPMISVLLASQELGANDARVLAKGDSSDASGDTDRVVGYMAAAFFENPQTPAHEQQHASQQAPEAEYGAEERELLHQVARQAIASSFADKDYAPPEDAPDHLREERGAFVTLKRQGRLRGCIGHVVGDGPLIETVAEMARAAAFDDPRFKPLQQDELEDLEYEISVLTPPRRITDVSEVQVGRHGLIMKSWLRQGLLLPQVPTEFGWDREQFLIQTCRKAGMDPDCWQDPDTEIYVFSAEVF